MLRADKLDDKTADPQLRPRRRGHVARRGAPASMAAEFATAAAGAARRGHRLRRRRPDLRAAAAAPRLRRHDLRDDGAARHDVEHVARRLHADVRPGRQRRAHAGVGRAVPAGGRDLVSPAAAAGRAALRRLVDGQLLADRRAARSRSAGANPSCCRTRAPQPVREVLGPASIRSRRSTRSSAPQMRIEPSIYLDALVQRLPALRRQDRHPQVRHAARSEALERDAIVNCTGLGAKALFDDQELVPLKGQLTVLMPQDRGELSAPTAACPPRARRPASSST